NYCEIEEFVHGRRGVEGVQARDLLSGQVQTVRTRTIVNWAGPWGGRLRAMARVAARTPQLLRTTKGIHCLLPRMTDRAVYLSAPDARMIFVSPWRRVWRAGASETSLCRD